MKVDTRRRVRAFAPGHVTGIFAPSTEARDPRGRGSRGAGLVLELGVQADAEHRPGGPRRVRVIGGGGAPLPISADAARRLAFATGSTTVRLGHQLPIGQGFGMSAAGAAATALAVARLADAPRARAIETAHLADLYGGGGLGGVAAILGGGLELRVASGIPPWGRVVHHRVETPVILAVSGGPMPSPRLLRDASVLARIDRAASGLDALLRHPDFPSFLDASEEFTDRVGLAPKELRDLIRGLRWRGARAAQAMFGQSLFAVPGTDAARRAVVRWLLTRGVRAVELRPATAGARAGAPQPF